MTNIKLTEEIEIPIPISPQKTTRKQRIILYLSFPQAQTTPNTTFDRKKKKNPNNTHHHLPPRKKKIIPPSSARASFLSFLSRSLSLLLSFALIVAHTTELHGRRRERNPQQSKRSNKASEKYVLTELGDAIEFAYA